MVSTLSGGTHPSHARRWAKCLGTYLRLSGESPLLVDQITAFVDAQLLPLSDRTLRCIAPSKTHAKRAPAGESL